LASTWTTAQHKLRRQCMEKESNRPHLAQDDIMLVVARCKTQ
jgi:hypothetical protein